MEQAYATYFVAFALAGMFALILDEFDSVIAYGDLIALFSIFYFRWAAKRPFHLPFRLPKYAGLPDPRNPEPGQNGSGKSEGILYMGNTADKDNPDCGQEIWFTNNDARTHILYLGTTGSGKTEGLKALVTNALAWGSGYVFVDGKADTDLWASLSSIARRFGRDDDLLLLNYMTGNSDDGSMSNSMNPFSNGSSSYLANMITNFMPEAGGDNAMWKERAVALMFALMPALTYKRDKQGMLMDIGVVRDHIELQPIIRLSRDPTLPERIANGLTGYLRTLPGFVDAAFDDEGNERPPSPDQPMYDLQIARQQHGYLSMQFTRSLQMLADEYGYIFKAQLADVEVLDVVLNRRILISLIPALEKSGDEAANLGKIVATTLKGMMGATLGNAVEGTWETAINSKQTRSASSFMTVFDEVGYYTAAGMAVMAAQARSLGFSLVFASQDLPSMEKRIKQEARSITGNCNIKIFGRIEDPLDTKDFLEKHGGQFWTLETAGMTAKPDTAAGLFVNNPYFDNMAAGSVQLRQRLAYDHIRDQREGEIHLTYGDWVSKGKMFFVNYEKVKALRVHKFLPVPSTTSSTAARDRAMNELITRLKDPEWTAKGAAAAANTSSEIAAIVKTLAGTNDPFLGGIMAVSSLDGVTVTKMPTAAAPDEMDLEAPVKPKVPLTVAEAAAAKSSPTAAAQAKNAPITIPSITTGENGKQRATLPPLYEGDQYTVVELEASPVTEGGSALTPNFASMDSDFSIVSPVSMADMDDDGGVLDVQLNESITAILEESARKLNKGLGGTGETTK
jgi:intracellular multiplication protein IcmO